MSDAPRSLRELVRAAFGDAAPAVDVDVVVGGVTCDTRTLHRRDLFVAVPGTKEDGSLYAEAAVAAGAGALIVEEGASVKVGAGFPVVRVPDARTALGLLASEFHGRPSDAMCVVGVTGTNGKTTTTHLLRSVLEAAERGPCALLGTISYAWPGHTVAASNTTPGAHELQGLLGAARAAGCRSAAVEVSSHALDQGRTAGLRMRAAAFTNLSGDHLDYHGAMDTYAEAKARLFRDLDPSAVAAVNAEDGYTPVMVRDCLARVIRFGLDEPSRPDVTAIDLDMGSDGVRFTLATPAGEAYVRSPLLGRYNVLNLLAAGAVGVGLGIEVETVATALSLVRGVRGRLEPVDQGQPFQVLVDYAHTDDAVRNVLTNLRAVVNRRLIAVLGCGGDRDRTKRPRMARVAAELADVCWLTSDNPRTEDPHQILFDMLAGVSGARNVQVEADRASAIERAVAEARPGDCVAILGKGHEDYQVLGTRKVPFDDRSVAAGCLERLGWGDQRADARDNVVLTSNSTKNSGGHAGNPPAGGCG